MTKLSDEQLKNLKFDWERTYFEINVEDKINSLFEHINALNAELEVEKQKAYQEGYDDASKNH